MTFPWLKGHGTENDFVLLPDHDGTVHGQLDGAFVAALCDRRRGIGADGVMRVIRTSALGEDSAGEWFMDYRNHDGSLSEMCGNGIRVFALHLLQEGLVDAGAPLVVGTRGGDKTITVEADGMFSVDMGVAEVRGTSKITAAGRTWEAQDIRTGNPHAVAFVDSLTDPGPLLDAPEHDTETYPDGVNVEFVVREGARHVAMRVHERGSGETRSCGTGACAVGLAAALADGAERPVDLPRRRPRRHPARHLDRETTTSSSPAPPRSSPAATWNGSHDSTEPDFELEERNSLRRVAGLSTELEDISEVEYRQLRLERVVLVGVWTEGTAEDAENSLTELKLLAETAGSEVLDALMQRRPKPDPATYIGRGKVDELRDVAQATGADTIICDGELAPSQLRNLEDRTKVKVVDRTALILDIFAQHAKSAEGKAQVEMAQLQYQTQRLRGWGGQLSRQAGGRAAGGEGIGGRGPGETKLETDRRRIQTKIAKLRRELAALRTTRDTKKAQRRRHHVPSVSIAGYTNAGKSSLLNRLTGAGVLVEDALFATLDPTTRRTQTSDGRIYTLSDTVGFVRHLPHQLVEAFRSTLEEVAESDLVLHVVDGSHPDPEGQIAAVREVLLEIGAAQVPEIVVVNKADIADPLVVKNILAKEPHAVVVSAHTGEGIDELLSAIEADLPRPATLVDVVVPYSRGDLLSQVHETGEIESLDHAEDGTHIVARVNDELAHQLTHL